MGRVKRQKQQTKESSSSKKKSKLKSKPKPIPNLLTLAEKISVINEYEKIGNVRKLSKMYLCSRAQIRNIWRRKNEFLTEWDCKSGKESSMPEKTVILDEAVREWARRWRSPSISDARITETAVAIAKLMKMKYYRVSETWKKRIKEIIKKDKIKAVSVKNPKGSKKSLKPADILFDVKETFKMAVDSTETLKESRRFVEESDSDSPHDDNISESSTTLGEFDFERSEDTNEEPRQNNKVVQESDPTALVEMEIEDKQEEIFSVVVKEEEKTVENSIDVIEIKNNEVEVISVKEEQPDVIPVKHEELCEDEDISSYEEALYYLEALGDFALVKEDFRAIGIINQLEDWYSEQMRKNS